MTTIVACHSHQGAAPSRPASDRHPRYRSPHCSGCPGSRTGCSSAAACGRQCGHERQETSVAHRNGLVRRNLLDALRVGTSPRNRAVSSVARGERGRASHLHGESGNAAFGQRLGRVSRVKAKGHPHALTRAPNGTGRARRCSTRRCGDGGISGSDQAMYLTPGSRADYAWRASGTATAGAVRAGRKTTGKSGESETAASLWSGRILATSPGSSNRGPAGRTRRRTTAAGRVGARKERAASAASRSSQHAVWSVLQNRASSPPGQGLFREPGAVARPGSERTAPARGPAWPCWPPPRCWPWPRLRRPRPRRSPSPATAPPGRWLERTRSRQARPIPIRAHADVRQLAGKRIFRIHQQYS